MLNWSWSDLIVFGLFLIIWELWRISSALNEANKTLSRIAYSTERTEHCIVHRMAETLDNVEEKIGFAGERLARIDDREDEKHLRTLPPGDDY